MTDDNVRRGSRVRNINEKTHSTTDEALATYYCWQYCTLLKKSWTYAVVDPWLVYSFPFFRLQEVLKEYDDVVSTIPENILPLMKPFTNRVDETIKPGLTMLNWTSLNVHSCKYYVSYWDVCDLIFLLCQQGRWNFEFSRLRWQAVKVDIDGTILQNFEDIANHNENNVPTHLEIPFALRDKYKEIKILKRSGSLLQF